MKKPFFMTLLLGTLVFLEPASSLAVVIDNQSYQIEEIVMIYSGSIGGSSIIVYPRDPGLSFVMASGVGDQPLEIKLSGDIFVPGEYILVNTKDPNGCQSFTLDECRVQEEFLGETPFSISTPIIDTITADINDIATSTITTVDIDGKGIVATSNETGAVSTETTNTDSFWSVISAFSNTASSTSNNSSTSVGPEEQTDTFIVSDTNAESITSSLSQSDETATSTTPKAEVEASPLSADTDNGGGGVITSEF